jgi:hypothetical protein
VIGKNDGEPVGVEIPQANLRITSLILKFLCDGDLWIQDHQRSGLESFSRYASLYFAEHLANIDPRTMAIDAKRRIIGHLYQVFQDENCLERWLGKLLTLLDWRCNKRWIEVLQKWLNDEEGTRALAEDSYHWIDAVTANDASISAFAKILLKPMAKVASKIWLENTLWVSSEYCLFIDGYITMVCPAISCLISLISSFIDTSTFPFSYLY